MYSGSFRTFLGAVSIIVAISFPTAFANASDTELAEDLAAALCGVLGATTGNNSVAAGGAIVCKYATRATGDAVASLIDSYFDGEDQKFADETCVTIQYEGGKVIKPSEGSGC